MKYLVTGGLGFIGSNIIEYLIQQNHKVVSIDNCSTGYKENAFNHPNVEYKNVSITNFPDLIELFEKEQCFDAVFHTAALPRVTPSIKDPLQSHDVNVNGTINVFEACRRFNINKIVFSSSSSVYGEQTNLPTSETDCHHLNPTSPYAMQKLIGEQYAKLYCDLYNMDIVCLRYFNVFADRQPTEGAYVPVIGIWLRQYANGEPITITGDGEQTRDFVHVKDVVNANLEAINIQGFQEFNVGSGESYSLNELADLFPCEKKYIEARNEPKHTQASTVKLETYSNWKSVNSDVKVYIEDRVNL